MAHEPNPNRFGAKTLLSTTVLAGLAWGAESFSPGLYDVTTETGSAAWELGEHRITGTLHVKLGGKNMTFHQRLTAIARGECAPSRG